MNTRGLFFKCIQLLLVVSLLLPVTACSDRSSENQVLIYSSAEEYRNEHFQKRLNQQFPEYDIVIEYMPSGNLAAKLQAEGKDAECDIVLDLEYGYAAMLEENFADLSDYDQSIFTQDAQSPTNNYLPTYRNGGAIIVNLDVLAQKGLDAPKSYDDLLDAKWKGLISMPAPKSSGTGYMFLKSLVNAWGEAEAFDYFDKLSENILQFTSSGSGPVNALVQGEAAIGLGMIGQAVTAINEGANLQILFFEEGSPYTMYGYAMIDGKEERQCVKDVFEFFYSTLIDEDKELFFPEQIYTDKTFTIENYPAHIPYADMSGNTSAEKTRLLEKWAY